jgi:hypothetical protein
VQVRGSFHVPRDDGIHQSFRGACFDWLSPAQGHLLELGLVEKITAAEQPTIAADAPIYADNDAEAEDDYAPAPEHSGAVDEIIATLAQRVCRLPLALPHAARSCAMQASAWGMPPWQQPSSVASPSCPHRPIRNRQRSADFMKKTNPLKSSPFRRPCCDRGGQHGKTPPVPALSARGSRFGRRWWTTEPGRCGLSLSPQRMGSTGCLRTGESW